MLSETEEWGYINYYYFYNGGGVAIGDVNNDGLHDIYFTGNMVTNKLYLNKGDLKFEDVTDEAEVGGDDRWMAGVTIQQSLL
ncbi:MAG: FG-GAP-like repeat-containing protein [Cytophagales bacterium]|nr:FG-GAP-like repeat-containing protein [Cytophagales bacterium]